MHPLPAFSGAFPRDYGPNPLTKAKAARGYADEFLDLTLANPTAVGLTWPDLSRRLAACDWLSYYEAAPGGQSLARRAVEAYYGDRQIQAPVDQILLTASTSESYNWLLTLIAGHDDCVMLPTPGYPLCGDIARFAAWRTAQYRLQLTQHGWRPDRDDITRGLDAGARAVIVIHPHNPTGAYLSADDQRWLQSTCADAGAILIVDEVFADYPWASNSTAPALPEFCYQDSPALMFVLGGLAKALALPQLKCSWIVSFGPEVAVARAHQHLEYLADTYLSVAGPTQALLPALLADRTPIQRRIASRLAANNRTLARGWPGLDTPANGGGWWRLCPLRRGIDDEEFALALLREQATVVHPGYLFDAAEPAVAVSLITPEMTFAEGVARLTRMASLW